MKYNYIVILLVVISISLSFIVILSSQSLSNSSFVGQATSVDSGKVSLAVSTYLSILLPDSSINFGSCAINTSTNTSLFDSNKSSFWLDNSLCVNGTFPDFIIVENDGTRLSNIVVQINQTGAQLFNDSNAWFSFKAGNNSVRPGCSGFLQSNYTNFSLSGIDYPLCSSLSYMNYEDQINFYMQAYVTTNSSEGGNATVQFTASAI